MQITENTIIIIPFLDRFYNIEIKDTSIRIIKVVGYYSIKFKSET